MVQKMVVVDAACERVKFVLPIMTYAKPSVGTSGRCYLLPQTTCRQVQFKALQSAQCQSYCEDPTCIYLHACDCEQCLRRSRTVQHLRVPCHNTGQ
jgi:hypothetical protein